MDAPRWRRKAWRRKTGIVPECGNAAARATVAIWRNRLCYPGGLFKNVVRLLVLIPLIALLDAATVTGTLQWAVRDKAGL